MMEEYIRANLKNNGILASQERIEELYALLWQIVNLFFDKRLSRAEAEIILRGVSSIRDRLPLTREGIEQIQAELSEM